MVHVCGELPAGGGGHWMLSAAFGMRALTSVAQSARSAAARLVAPAAPAHTAPPFTVPRQAFALPGGVTSAFACPARAPSLEANAGLVCELQVTSAGGAAAAQYSRFECIAEARL